MRILIIDDHALFCAGLSELLERRGICVIATANKCDDGLRQIIAMKPDVVLLDLRMRDVSGFEVLKQLQLIFPETVSSNNPVEIEPRVKANLQNMQNIKMPIVVVLTTSRDEQDVINAMLYGAKGYLLKDMEPNDLIAALHKVIHGEIVVAKEFTQILANMKNKEHTRTAIKNCTWKDLTPRESEILCLIAEGQSNKIIARNLGISHGTVKIHVKAILRKLKVHSRVEAAVLSIQEGFCRKNVLHSPAH